MASRPDDVCVLWPVYFDRDRSRADGRRVPEELAVQRPDWRAVRQAAEELGYDAEADPDARHPSEPWEARGRVRVSGVERKEELLHEVARILADRDEG